MDWKLFFAKHGVTYIDRGANVKRGHLNIRCPMCGSADPSYHLGVNPGTGAWACWRNSHHRGQSPVYLVQQLLNCSSAQARDELGMEKDQNQFSTTSTHDAFSTLARSISSGRGVTTAEKPDSESKSVQLEYPPVEFKTFDKLPPRFYEYLATTRGFTAAGVHTLERDYGVLGCAYTAFKERVILPYYDQGRVVAWTARAISSATLRYKALADDLCLVPPRTLLFNSKHCAGGKELFIVEGPIDALKLSVFGRRYHRGAVALATNSITSQQQIELSQLASRYTRVTVMMDAATTLGIVDSMSLASKLSFIPNLHSFEPPPFGAKDAGDLSVAELHEYFQTRD